MRSLLVKLTFLFMLGGAFLTTRQPVALGAEAAVDTHLDEGRKKFTAKNYDEAIDLIRKHLRHSPKDYNAWNLLAAAYYYTGQPRRALRYLKHVEKQTTEKSYNYYYQGLCFEAISPASLDASTPAEVAKAKEFFTFAAQRYTDEYASRSAYEVGVIEYNARNKPRAMYWLTFYLQHYPHGVYGIPAQRLVESLKQNQWYDNVEGTKKPDMEDALFRYNKLSLGPVPHYWFVQAGTQYSDLNFQQPLPAGKFGSTDLLDISAIANAGVGIGPIKQDDMTVFAGYTYRQFWHTDSDRINEWLEGPTAIQYFPFRADLLERQHIVYADLRREFYGKYYIGMYSSYEFARIGSTVFPSPQIANLRLTLDLSETQLLIPWVGVNYGNMRTLFYLYMRKTLASDTPDFSNKTYDFGTSGGSPTMSFGLSHTMEFPQYDLAVDLEAFQYEFIYNDFWLDYKRQGFFASVEEEFIPHWVANGVVGYYRDQYVLPRVKSNSCTSVSTSDQTANNGGSGGSGGGSGAGTTTTDPTTAAPVVCDRTDTGLLFQLGLYWNISQFQRIAFFVQYVQNQNATQQEFSSTKETINIMYTMAFPSVKRVSRFIDRFADIAFTKEAQ